MRLRCLAAALAVSATLSFPAAADTLFDALGKRPGIERIVDTATAIFVKDPRIADEFDNINFNRLKPRLVDLFCQLSGGGCVYTGRDMRATHKGLHLQTRHFNALAEDLQLAMEQVGIPYSAQNRLLALLAPMHRDVVSR